MFKLNVMLVTATKLPLTYVGKKDAENFVGPDQEENPARKKSVGLGSIVARIASSTVASIVASIAGIVSSIIACMRASAYQCPST